MNLHTYIPLFLLMVFQSVFAMPKKDKDDSYLKSGKIPIDSISIHKNWLTWDRIIFRELGFRAGDTVSSGQIDTAINKIWNIDNFAEVKYGLLKTPEGKTHLKITAMDAIKLIPVVPINFSSKKEYNLALGVEDANFIGSNVLLKVKANKKTDGTDWNFKSVLPRQILYKNATLEFGAIFGRQVSKHIKRVVTKKDNGDVDSVSFLTTMAAPFKKTEVYGDIGNPFHLDYKYRFSPDFGWRFLHHEFDSNLAGESERKLMVEPYTLNLLKLSLSESVGIVNTKRHRKNGYRLMGAVSTYVGMDKKSKSHQTIEFEAEYHKIFNSIIQFSSWYKTGFTNTKYKALEFCKGPEDIIGHRTGEISGPAYYVAYIGLHFTWVNTSWFSFENAYFLNWGAGRRGCFDIYTSQQKLAAGSSLRFQIPAVPFLYGQFTFSYSGPGGEWFNFKNN